MTDTQNANIGWGRTINISEGSIRSLIAKARHTFTANRFRKIFMKTAEVGAVDVQQGAIPIPVQQVQVVCEILN